MSLHVPMSLQRWLVKAILIHGGSQLFLIVLYVTGVLLIELANVLQPDNKLHLAMVSVGIVAACSVYLLFAVVVVAYPQYLLLIYTIACVEGRDGQPERDKGWLVYGWHHHPAGMVVAYIIVTAVAVGEAVSEHMETGNSWHDTLFDLTWVANQMLVLVTAALEYTMAASGTTRYESDVRDKTVDNHLTVGKLMVLDALAPDQHWQRLTMCRLVQLLAAGNHGRVDTCAPCRRRCP